MNADNFALAEDIVSKAYVRQAQQAHRQRENMIQTLLTQRRMPEEGWDDLTIEFFMHELAIMDSNNFVENVGVGEREARIASALVAKRHYYIAHGIGRSGDVAAVQPKAAGSSLIVKLTNAMALEALRIAGGNKHFAKACLVLPLATGMAASLTLLTLKQFRPETAKYVLWPRMDQKSCLKSIQTAGFIPVVVPNKMEGDEVRTDLDALERLINEIGPSSILCIFSTSSCFAPRAPDRIVDIAVMCKNYGIGHIINNAYGVQTSKSMHLITEACRMGRVDAFVQSTDKNFLVPVGGAIVAGPDSAFIESINSAYPGRASASPIIDLFITLLSLGSVGYKRLLRERKELFAYFTDKLAQRAEVHGERLLKTPNNPISFGMTLSSLEKIEEGPSLLGSMLFSRCCSGNRIVTAKERKSVAGITFDGYGAHIDGYPTPYLTAACAIGLSKAEVDLFLSRLDKTMSSLLKKKAKCRRELSPPRKEEPKKSETTDIDTPIGNDHTQIVSDNNNNINTEPNATLASLILQ